MEIKQLSGINVDEAFSLAFRVFKKNIRTTHFGYERFKYNIVYNERYRKTCKKGICKLFGGFINDTLVGFAGIDKNADYITFLFVEDEYQRQGIGKSLFEYIINYVRSEYNKESIMINSTDNAVPFYIRVGAIPDGVREEHNGVMITPMKYIIKGGVNE